MLLHVFVIRKAGEFVTLFFRDCSGELGEKVGYWISARRYMALLGVFAAEFGKRISRKDAKSQRKPQKATSRLRSGGVY
jgi:hypothetical protein